MNNKNVCIGTGLVALDVVLNGNPKTPAKLYAGGSCGNVLSILSYLGWKSFPVARFAENKAAAEVENDFKKWKVDTSLISKTQGGSTPIIIHRILKDNNGRPKHRFEFRDPDTGAWLPGYKPILHKEVPAIAEKQPCNPTVFYFDRVSRGNLDLAELNKKAGAVIYFEPSSTGDNLKMFKECVDLADVIKFSKDRIHNYSQLFPKQQAVLEIETLGSEGLLYRFSKSKSSKTWHYSKSHIINNVVDTAGAGDWCSAGIISKLCIGGKQGLQDWDSNTIKHALDYGQILGAINCCFQGARGVMYNMNTHELKKSVQRVKKSKAPVDIVVTNKNGSSNSAIIKLASLYK